ncbi:MAG: lipopolysaccharide biosynthesis protein [Gaiellaceae bacterium]
MSSGIGRLVRHSAVYGIGGLAARVVAVFLLPVYTRFVNTSGYGAVETLTATEAVAVIVLRGGMQSAFFRFYFDSKETAYRTRVVRTAFWYTMTMATVGLVLGLVLARPLSSLLLGSPHHIALMRTIAVTLWADMNYQQMTALFRVEERSRSYVLASLCNLTVTITATLLLVVHFHKGALGLMAGNVTGTLAVYFALLVYRRFQLGLEFDRGLFRAMNQFGMPLVPSALAVWVTNLLDRWFVRYYKGLGETGLYSAGAKIASAMTLLITAFTLAWPAFAYSIEDDRRAKRTYAFVLTYVMLVLAWAALALSALAPWLVHLLGHSFHRSDRVVAWLAFGSVAYAGYAVTMIGVGRVRRTRSNWIITGTAAVVNVGLNFALIPRWGMIGAAIATLVAYSVMFAGMTVRAQRLYPVPYQWPRVATAVGVAGAEAVLAHYLHSLPLALLLIALYPLLLALLGFYLPAERARFSALLRRRPVTG